MKRFPLVLLLLLSLAACGSSDRSTAGSQEPATPASESMVGTAVAEWNQTAMSMTPTLGTHMGIRALAMMHTAVYDALVAFDGSYSPYLVTVPGANGGLPVRGGRGGGL
jgi:hypothetical protein